MPVAEGAGPGPGWPRPAQPRAVLGPAPQSSWLAPCLQEDTTRRPQAPGPLETQGDPSLLRHLDMPTWSREGVLPPQLHLRSISAPAPPPPLQLRGGPGLAPCVQATTTPHPREGRGVTPPWGSHSCSLPLCGSGGWALVTEQSWGHQTPRPCVSPVVLGHLMAHADAALRWGKVQRCVWFLGNRRS